MPYNPYDTVWTLVNDYLRYIAHEQNLAEGTVRTYRTTLTHFARWCGSQALTDPERITAETIRVYRAQFPDWKVKTQEGRLITLRSFLKYGRKHHGIQMLHEDEVVLPKVPERQPHYLPLEEIQHLIEQPNSATSIGLRDRAVMAVLFSTALRVSELESLNTAQIDWDTGTTEVRGKGSKIRPVFFSKRALQYLREYLVTRTDSDPWLFAQTRGGRLGKRSIEKLVKCYGAQLGLEVHPHLFRHSFATYNLEQGIDIRTIQGFLGHSSIMTTQIYTHTRDAHLQAVHERVMG